jgi:hypothetical protein
MQTDPARTTLSSAEPAPSGMPVRTTRRPRATALPSSPTVGQIADELMVYVTGLVAGAAIMPGFFLCVPGLVFVIGFIAVPALALALLATAVALVILLATAPVIAGRRLAGRLRRAPDRRRAAHEPRREPRPRPGRDGVPLLPPHPVQAPRILARTVPADVEPTLAVHRSEGT